MSDSRVRPPSCRGLWKSAAVLLTHGLLTAVLIGCRATGPEVPRYEPQAHVAPAAVESWGTEVWTAARSGDSHRLEDLLAAPPAADAWRQAMEDRLATLDDDDAAARRDASARLVDDLAETEPGNRDHARLLVESAERRTLDEGSPHEELEAALDIALDAGLEHWRKTAIRAEAAGEVEEAIEAWIVVQAIATAPRHAEIQLHAMDRVSRLASRRPGTGRRDPLPPGAVTDCLQVVLKNHVDRLEWTALVDAGFDALSQAVNALDDPEPRTRGLAFVTDLRKTFAASVAPSIPGGPSLRPLPSSARRTVDRLADELADARDDGDLPAETADPIRVFIDGMLEATDLRTRAFLGNDAESLRRLLGASFVGIGVRFEPHPDGLAVHPLPGGPARRAGLRTGDIVTAIDGVDVDAMTGDEIVMRASGRRGTGVELRVLRNDGREAETIVVVRDRIEIESVHGWRQLGVDGRGRPRWDWIVDPEAAIAYVSIREFDRDTDRLFRQAMVEADRAVGPDRLVQGLILDLRENPGGDRVATERLLDLFLNDGDVFRAVGELTIDTSTRATIASTRLAGLPVVVLVSGHSASASELVAGTLQGAADAVVVGARTFGKGSVQGVHPVRHGYVLVTESWFMVPSGPNGAWRPIDRAKSSDWGVTPTIPVPMSSAVLQDALAERGEWSSRLGRDIEDDSSPTVTLETTTDRGLLTATVLLRARLLPTLVGTDHTDAVSAPRPSAPR